jgi:myo-inositol 2-dehydrogenase / D-chiro-inositol 1-dehydrogenase
MMNQKIGIVLVGHGASKKKNHFSISFLLKIDFFKKKYNCFFCSILKVGSILAENIRKMRGTQLLYVVGSNKERVEKFVNDYEGCKASTNLQECLKDEKVKAVFIASPEKTHREYIETSLNAGKAVFCEKAMCLSSEEIKNCYELAKNRGLLLMTAFNRRFDKSFSKIKECLDNKTLGEVPEMIKITSRDPPLSSNNGEELHPIWRSMIHDFDTALWLSGGQKVIDVHAVQPSNNVVLVVLKFEKGTIATINFAHSINYGYDQRVEIQCAGGMLQIENEAESTIQISNAIGKRSDELKNSFASRYSASYEKEVDHFIDCLKNNKQTIIKSEEVISGAEIAELAIKCLGEKGKNNLKVSKLSPDLSLNLEKGKRLDKQVVNVILLGAGRMG